MSTLEARELSCGYGRRRVIEALSLEANPGEVLVLLGPNGAGKTTLLRALAALAATDAWVSASLRQRYLDAPQQ